MRERERERFSLLYSIVTLDVPDLSLWGGVGVIGIWDGVGDGIVVSGSVGIYTVKDHPAANL